jgi:hypothetical protein
MRNEPDALTCGAMLRRSSFAFLLSFVCACGPSETEEDTQAEEESGDDENSGSDTETGGGDPACFPEGIYGPCSGENMGCQCLMGADVYQVCTANCTTDADCGDPADFPAGATPQCRPVNPGAMEMVCSLACTSSAQCPCGLTCQTTTTGICAESL